jgi:ABC-2 type transport system permease protein
MNFLDYTRLVAGREISSKLRDKAFIVSTVLVLVLVLVSITVPLILNRNSDRPERELAVVGAPALGVAETARATGQEAIRADDRRSDELEGSSVTEPGPAVRTGETVAPTVRLTIRPVPDVAAAEALVRDGTVDAALVTGDDGRLSLIGDSEVDDDLGELVTVAAQTAALTAGLDRAGIQAAEQQQLLNPTPPQQRLLDPDPPNGELAFLLAFAFAGLFFVTAFGFGMQIATSVVEEKQSRVIELLVAAVPVRALLAGKVVGNTLMALAQVVLLLAVGLGATAAAGQSAAVTLLLHSGGWFLLFFVLGFAMLACLWAAAGALCARQEDLQSTTAPMQLVIFGPFFAAMYVTEPGRWLTLLSYVPFTAPLSMPRRILLGDVQWWEPVLAAGGIVVTGAVLVLIATRIYENSLLRTGTKTSYGDAWRSGRRASVSSS